MVNTNNIFKTLGVRRLFTFFDCIMAQFSVKLY